MNKSNLILASVSAIIFTSILIIFSPNSQKLSLSFPTPSQILTESISPTLYFTATTNIAPSETEKSEIKNESEIISLDNVWNLYKNYQLGFSIKFPKIALNSWANCREENGQFYNQEGPLPITVYEGQKYVHIAPKYFYDPIKEDKDGYYIYSGCIKTNVTSDLIEKRIILPGHILPNSIWRIMVKDINNEQELDQFVKSSYGSGCTYTLKETPHNDIFKVQVNYDGADDLSTSKCPINFALEFRYSPKYHKAATWGIGQEPTFLNEGDIFDGEMTESFIFFK